MGQPAGLSYDRIPWMWILVAAGALFYIPFIGGVALFDWDEINFAEISREMIVTGDYLNIQVNYKAFFEKPPFFFWLQVLSMKTFGINEFAARLPNALAGIMVLVLLYKTGTRWIISDSDCSGLCLISDPYSLRYITSPVLLIRGLTYSSFLRSWPGLKVSKALHSNGISSVAY